MGRVVGVELLRRMREEAEEMRVDHAVKELVVHLPPGRDEGCVSRVVRVEVLGGVGVPQVELPVDLTE